MTLQEQMINYKFEITGFLSSSSLSAIKFSEFFSRGIEVAAFAFITGIVGAFGAHLYKIMVNKFSKK